MLHSGSTSELNLEQIIQKLNEMYKFITIVKANNFPETQYLFSVNSHPLDTTKMLVTDLPEWKKWFGTINSFPNERN